jgi:hypothetical protein
MPEIYGEIGGFARMISPSPITSPARSTRTSKKLSNVNVPSRQAPGNFFTWDFFKVLLKTDRIREWTDQRAEPYKVDWAEKAPGSHSSATRKNSLEVSGEIPITV